MVAEVTLSLVLLTGAGLALRGLFALQEESLGYNPQNALTFRVLLSEGRYTQWAARLGFYQGIVNRLRRLPQVSRAFAGARWLSPLRICSCASS
jgi:putative ABC transport system permease protein